MTTAGELARHIGTLWPWEPECITEPHLWVGFTDAGPGLKAQQDAVERCGDCRVKDMCAEAGVGEPFVWGGRTSKERELQARRDTRVRQRVMSSSRPFTVAVCEYCGASYPRTNQHSNQRYCSPECSRAVRRERYQFNVQVLHGQAT